MMKKRSQRGKHCALAVVIKSGAKKFRPVADPFPGGAGRPKFNQLEMVAAFTYTNPVCWGSMHAISSYRGNRHTNTLTYPQTDKQTHRQDWLQYIAPLSLARSTISRCLVFRDSYCSPSRHSACIGLHKIIYVGLHRCRKRTWK